MRGSISILSGAVLGAMVWGAAIAAPAGAPTVEKDCQKMGGEVSALIDAKGTSPNISMARSIFQTGIMECIEGDDAGANKDYQDAKNLLTSDLKATPAAPVKPAVVAATPVADKSCQKLGGEVSALIDARRTSSNIASARAVFQAGIMDCMEGDDAAANKHYGEAKNLLSGD
ncbi:MAG: hypothetical protein QOF03_118 [Alphaproteobacteria bacterium]|jgi:hypothetical protein|nr:hypothetical protein [Alphaproteobacteria bacterium]